MSNMEKFTEYWDTLSSIIKNILQTHYRTTLFWDTTSNTIKTKNIDLHTVMAVSLTFFQQSGWEFQMKDCTETVVYFFSPQKLITWQTTQTEEIKMNIEKVLEIAFTQYKHQYKDSFALGPTQALTSFEAWMALDKLLTTTEKLI